MTTDNLGIRSSQNDRTQAVSDCVKELLTKNPGIDQAQATSMCIDAANKRMGTKEPLERPR